MTTTKAGGRLVGRVIVVHTDEGKMYLQIQRTIVAPMLAVCDSAGNEFTIECDDYERASRNEQAQFYAARADTTLAKAVTWN